MTEYCVSDIDSVLAYDRREAARYGWHVECEGDNPLAERSLLPAIDPEDIMHMVRLAYRRGCERTCGDYCYQAHPLLQIGRYSYCKLCTVAWQAAVKARGSTMRNIRKRGGWAR